jgi:hypothetical protein
LLPVPGKIVVIIYCNSSHLFSLGCTAPACNKKTDQPLFIAKLVVKLCCLPYQPFKRFFCKFFSVYVIARKINSWLVKITYPLMNRVQPTA